MTAAINGIARAGNISAEATTPTGNIFAEAMRGYELEDLIAEEDLDATRFREAASSILSQARGGEPTRRAIDQRLRQLPNYAWSAGDLYENEAPVGH
jgi:hypothetical protein